jgi:hypothetical protein
VGVPILLHRYCIRHTAYIDNKQASFSVQLLSSVFIDRLFVFVLVVVGRLSRSSIDALGGGGRRHVSGTWNNITRCLFDILAIHTI